MTVLQSDFLPAIIEQVSIFRHRVFVLMVMLIVAIGIAGYLGVKYMAKRQVVFQHEKVIRLVKAGKWAEAKKAVKSEKIQAYPDAAMLTERIDRELAVEKVLKDAKDCSRVTNSVKRIQAIGECVDRLQKMEKDMREYSEGLDGIDKKTIIARIKTITGTRNRLNNEKSRLQNEHQDFLANQKMLQAALNSAEHFLARKDYNEALKYFREYLAKTNPGKPMNRLAPTEENLNILKKILQCYKGMRNYDQEITQMEMIMRRYHEKKKLARKYFGRMMVIYDHLDKPDDLVSTAGRLSEILKGPDANNQTADLRQDLLKLDDAMREFFQHYEEGRENQGKQQIEDAWRAFHDTIKFARGSNILSQYALTIKRKIVKDCEKRLLELDNLAEKLEKDKETVRDSAKFVLRWQADASVMSYDVKLYRLQNYSFTNKTWERVGPIWERKNVTNTAADFGPPGMKEALMNNTLYEWEVLDSQSGRKVSLPSRFLYREN